MGTKSVKIDGDLNNFIWHSGLRHVPRRVRVSLNRKLNESEDSVDKFYTLVTYVPVASFKGLENTKLEAVEF